MFGMPFSVIFSIILIAVFIAVAFYFIGIFMDWWGCADSGQFIDDFQLEVDNAWKSQSSDKIFSGSLSSGIEYVCFADLSQSSSGNSIEREIYQELKKNADYTANLFFYPAKEACIKSTFIEHIKFSGNPYCIPVNGRVEIKLEKRFDENLVNVARK